MEGTREKKCIIFNSNICYDALDWAADLSESKEKAHYFLEALLYWLRQNQNHGKINLVLDTLKRFSYNINLKLQLEHLMLGLVS
jgi:hypothetical protein